MVNERKEPTVSSVLSSKEDPANKPSRTPISPQPKIMEKKILSPSVWVALLFAVIAMAAAGVSYWQLAQVQGMLQDQQVSLQNQRARILELENRLALSDDESAQSLVAVSAKLKEANSEIRKLWGVSYDTNRKAIKTNETAIASQKKTLQAQQATLNNSGQRLSEQELLMRTLRERVDEQAEGLKSDAIAAVDVKKRVKNNEEAIEAFDIFRGSVSRDLLQIKQQLKSSAGR